MSKNEFGPTVRDPAAKWQVKEIGLSDFAEELGTGQSKKIVGGQENYNDFPTPENPDQEGE